MARFLSYHRLLSNAEAGMTSGDTSFAGSIAAFYDRFLVPMKFRPYAEDLARRGAAAAPSAILETAAGTGIVTEAILRAAPEAALVATDLNEAMLAIPAARLPAAGARF